MTRVAAMVAMKPAARAAAASSVAASRAVVTPVARASRAQGSRSTPASARRAGESRAARTIPVRSAPAPDVRAARGARAARPPLPVGDRRRRRRSCESARASAAAANRCAHHSHRRTGSPPRSRCRTSGNASRHQGNKARHVTPHIAKDSASCGVHRARGSAMRPLQRSLQPAARVRPAPHLVRAACGCARLAGDNEPEALHRNW